MIWLRLLLFPHPYMPVFGLCMTRFHFDQSFDHWLWERMIICSIECYTSINTLRLSFLSECKHTKRQSDAVAESQSWVSWFYELDKSCSWWWAWWAQTRLHSWTPVCSPSHSSLTHLTLTTTTYCQLHQLYFYRNTF